MNKLWIHHQFPASSLFRLPTWLRGKIDEREEVIQRGGSNSKAGAQNGLDRDVRAMIDRKTGSIRLERWIEVVERLRMKPPR